MYMYVKVSLFSQWKRELQDFIRLADEEWLKQEIFFYFNLRLEVFAVFFLDAAFKWLQSNG